MFYLLSLRRNSDVLVIRLLPTSYWVAILRRVVVNRLGNLLGIESDAEK